MVSLISPSGPETQAYHPQEAQAIHPQEAKAIHPQKAQAGQAALTSKNQLQEKAAQAFHPWRLRQQEVAFLSSWLATTAAGQAAGEHQAESETTPLRD